MNAPRQFPYLTRMQRKLLEYIEHNIRTEGGSPSFEEMAEALGLRSKSGVHRMIVGLEERGYIKRLPNRARAIEIIRQPSNEKPKVVINLTSNWSYLNCVRIGDVDVEVIREQPLTNQSTRPSMRVDAERA